MILSDNQTKVDLLNYEASAATIVELLRELPDQPMTIVVYGDWGTGKTTFKDEVNLFSDIYGS